MSKKQLTVKQLASMGGKARAAKLAKERRSEIAKKAAQSRWKKRELKTDSPK